MSQRRKVTIRTKKHPRIGGLGYDLFHVPRSETELSEACGIPVTTTAAKATACGSASRASETGLVSDPKTIHILEYLDIHVNIVYFSSKLCCFFWFRVSIKKNRNIVVLLCTLLAGPGVEIGWFVAFGSPSSVRNGSLVPGFQVRSATQKTKT